MNSTATFEHHGKLTLVLALSLIITGFMLMVAFAFSQQAPPAPKVPVGNIQRNLAHTKIDSKPDFLSYSIPVTLSIPVIQVQSQLLTLGKNADGTVEVPSEKNYNLAAWYKYSPAPGQAGASIIEGHVDYEGHGPAIFFNLGKLKPDDRIYIQRADSTSVEFKVYKVATYAKNQFPSEEVYNVNDRAELRLITCGGDFNRQIGEYNSNTIVYASITK